MPFFHYFYSNNYLSLVYYLYFYLTTRSDSPFYQIFTSFREQLVSAYHIRIQITSFEFSKMKRLTVNLKIVAGGKQCLAATVLNVDKFTTMTSEDEAIALHVAKDFLQHKTYGLDEGMAFEAFRRRLEEEVGVEIGRFGLCL